MNRKYLVLAKIGLVFAGIILIFSVKTWAGTLIPISLATYNGPADGDDNAIGATVDGNGNIIVTGSSYNGTNNDYFTIKYNSDLSQMLTSVTYDGITNQLDRAVGVVIDGGGNIIVTGSSLNGVNLSYFTIKYNNDLSLTLGSATYNGPVNSMDVPYGIAIDGGGNIIVTGYVNDGTNNDYFTIKYNNDLSLVLGSATYNGPVNDHDWACAVAIDGEENIIVTGVSENATNGDYFTIKYNSDLSLVLGSATYNGPANGNDWAAGVTIDEEGNIVVTGGSDNGANDDYFTIKYNEDLSVVLSSASYNGLANSDDGGGGVAVDGGGNIIVTGKSSNGTNYDYFTIKYLGPPQVFSLLPFFGQSGETLDVVINGLNFYSGAEIVFGGGGITVNSVNFISAAQLQVNITIDDYAISGSRDITVTNIDETNGVLQSGFEIRENISYQEEEDSRFVEISPKIITPNGDGINDAANFIFTNPNNEAVEGMIFDLSGSVVRDSLPQNSDTSLIWDGWDNSGSCVSGKVYVYQIRMGGKIFNGTVVVAK